MHAVFQQQQQQKAFVTRQALQAIWLTGAFLTSACRIQKKVFVSIAHKNTITAAQCVALVVK